MGVRWRGRSVGNTSSWWQICIHRVTVEYFEYSMSRRWRVLLSICLICGTFIYSGYLWLILFSLTFRSFFALRPSYCFTISGNVAGRTVVLTVVRDWTLAVKWELNKDFLVRYVEASERSDQLLVNNNWALQKKKVTRDFPASPVMAHDLKLAFLHCGGVIIVVRVGEKKLIN